MLPKFSQLDAGVAILREAQRFLDMYEIAPNAQWSRPVDSEALVALMRATGWKPGWPYCAAFVEACYGAAAGKLAGPEVEALVRAKFAIHVLTTYRNVQARTHQGRPVPGSVFFMRKGQTSEGHTGLVLMAGERTMVTIEGNTSPGARTAASDREGDGIYFRIRPLTVAPSPGLHLIGFLDPLDHEQVQILLSSPPLKP
jgi:hypothetical protein